MDQGSKRPDLGLGRLSQTAHLGQEEVSISVTHVRDWNRIGGGLPSAPQPQSSALGGGWLAQEIGQSEQVRHPARVFQLAAFEPGQQIGPTDAQAPTRLAVDFLPDVVGVQLVFGLSDLMHCVISHAKDNAGGRTCVQSTPAIGTHAPSPASTLVSPRLSCPRPNHGCGIAPPRPRLRRPLSSNSGAPKKVRRPSTKGSQFRIQNQSLAVSRDRPYLTFFHIPITRVRRRHRPYYYRARYYDPRVGRFLSEDPLSRPASYVYADNNPVSLSDPSGKITSETALIYYTDTEGNVTLIAAEQQTLTYTVGVAAPLVIGEASPGPEEVLLTAVIYGPWMFRLIALVVAFGYIALQNCEFNNSVPSPPPPTNTCPSTPPATTSAASSPCGAQDLPDPGGDGTTPTVGPGK